MVLLPQPSEPSPNESKDRNLKINWHRHLHSPKTIRSDPDLCHSSVSPMRHQARRCHDKPRWAVRAIHATFGSSGALWAGLARKLRSCRRSSALKPKRRRTALRAVWVRAKDARATLRTHKSTYWSTATISKAAGSAMDSLRLATDHGLAPLSHRLTAPYGVP